VALTGKDMTTPDALAWMDRTAQIVVTKYGDRAYRVISLPMLFTFVGDSPGDADRRLAAVDNWAMCGRCVSNLTDSEIAKEFGV
jgi:hypothetical protein